MLNEKTLDRNVFEVSTSSIAMIGNDAILTKKRANTNPLVLVPITAVNT